MPEPDYEDDLVFPPKKEKIKNLTEDWKDGKLKRSQLYFLKDIDEAANLVAFLSEGNHFYDVRTKFEVTKRIEVLAPCYYNHFVELTKKLKAQKEELDQLKKLGKI